MSRGQGSLQRDIKEVLTKTIRHGYGPLGIDELRQWFIARAGAAREDALRPAGMLPATRHQGTGRPGRDTTSGNGGPGDPRRYTTVECFASATGETVKDTAHAKAIVAEMSDALSKMSKLGASK